jgi:hypothetical protein
MSSFTSPLKVEFVSANHWRLLEEFDYEVGDLGSGKIIHCPAGMETDFASIPRLFWNILSPYGSYGKAAIVHDYLYGIQGDYANKPNPQMYTRKQCDQILLEGMVVLGVNVVIRRIIYSAVRCFGGWAWKKGGANDLSLKT